MADGIDLGISELTDFEVIGAGGFSTVYVARDTGFNRRVAVKVLHSLDADGRRRFDRERAIMGQLSSHANVITPFRAGYTDNGAPYLVMEYVSGGSLEDRFRAHGRLPWREAVDYIVPVTAALGFAHDQGVLHRDVKPANILLADDMPKLTDFGIAAIRESTASQVAYTLSHCPPETFASGQDDRDERSDLYALASSLYTLIVGRPPFDIDGPDSQQAYMFRIIGNEVPVPPVDVMPRSLAVALVRSLDRDLDQRPQSAAAFSDILRDLRAMPNESLPVANPVVTPAATPPVVTPAVAPAATPAVEPPAVVEQPAPVMATTRLPVSEPATVMQAAAAPTAVGPDSVDITPSSLPPPSESGPRSKSRLVGLGLAVLLGGAVAGGGLLYTRANPAEPEAAGVAASLSNDNEEPSTTVASPTTASTEAAVTTESTSTEDEAAAEPTSSSTAPAPVELGVAPTELFRVRSASLGDERCLDANKPGSSVRSGAAYMEECAPSGTQQWEAVDVGDGRYRFRSRHWGGPACLDSNDPDAPSDTARHGALYMTPCDDAAAGQLWRLVVVGSDVQLRSDLHGDTSCLTSNDPDGAALDGASHMVPCSDDDGQLWLLTDDA